MPNFEDAATPPAQAMGSEASNSSLKARRTVKVKRILAPNPGRFTGPGTNTYLLTSSGEALLIDPGPLDRSHEEAILSAMTGLDLKGILVTHTHEDHAPLANPLAAELGVPAYGFASGPGFKPDALLVDEDRVSFGNQAAYALHTPGHSPDHLCFLVEDCLFTGDHIMGGSSVVVEDMTAYLASLQRLQQLHLARLYPGHGLVMRDPAGIVAGYVEHRLERERQVLSAVKTGANTIMEIVQAVYIDIDPALYPLAAMSVRAHLAKLAADGSVRQSNGDNVLPVGETA